MPDQRTPGYRRQKRRGKPALAFVEINGTRRYLGEYGTAESHRRYDALLAEWKSSGNVPTAHPRDLRVIELVDRYWAFAETYYRKPDGTPTSEQPLVKRALAVLVSLYGDLAAREFSPLKLKAVRATMVDKGWCRKVVNDMVHRVKRLFRWASENELVPPTVHHALRDVMGLKQGRSKVRESQPVKPVSEPVIEQTIRHLSPQVAAMVRLQLLTGARPGEICQMRTCDFETSGEVWVYRPASHKTEHHDHERAVYLGPKAQQVVGPLLKPDLQAYLFTPAEAESWHRSRRQAARKTPLSCGNVTGSNRKRSPKRKPGDRYTVTAYRRAVARACDVAFPPPSNLPRAAKLIRRWRRTRKGRPLPKPLAVAAVQVATWAAEHRWHPHQIRHTAATKLRKEHGLEAAQVILGHKTLTVTQVYAETNKQKAKEVIHKIG